MKPKSLLALSLGLFLLVAGLSIIAIRHKKSLDWTSYASVSFDTQNLWTNSVTGQVTTQSWSRDVTEKACQEIETLASSPEFQRRISAIAQVDPGDWKFDGALSVIETVYQPTPRIALIFSGADSQVVAGVTTAAGNMIPTHLMTAFTNSTAEYLSTGFTFRKSSPSFWQRWWGRVKNVFR